MTKYRKKPVVIEAIQFTGDNADEIKGLVWSNVYGHHPSEAHRVAFRKYTIRTLEGDMLVSPGDWVITGVNGERYPCKPDIFEKTYELVEEDRQP